MPVLTAPVREARKFFKKKIETSGWQDKSASPEHSAEIQKSTN